MAHLEADSNKAAVPACGSDSTGGFDPAEYADLRQRLEWAVKRVAPAWMRDQTDDIVQMAVMKIMKTGKIEDPDVQLNNSFLYRVAHSVIVDEIRRQRRRNETEIDPKGPDPVEPSVRTNPETMAGGQEIGAEIVDCLGRIAEQRRRAVTLYLQGHTVPEAAKFLGFSAKKAENLVYRGLSDLRACLKKKGLEP